MIVTRKFTWNDLWISTRAQLNNIFFFFFDCKSRNQHQPVARPGDQENIFSRPRPNVSRLRRPGAVRAQLDLLTSLFSLNTKWKAFNNVKSLVQIKQNGSLYTITMHLQICYKKLQITAKSLRKYNTLAQKHCFLLNLFKQTSHNPCSRKGKKLNE